jgi:hypothetical protein
LAHFDSRDGVHAAVGFSLRRRRDFQVQHS